MSKISGYLVQAELALAAYANLGVGTPDVNKLIDDGKGMSTLQANRFSDTYAVANQFTDSLTGLSATIFKRGDTSYLAIRGTEGITDWIADYLIITGIPGFLNPQYSALKAKVEEWIGDGALPSHFTVTGHSLGGYLAAGLMADFNDNIDRAYLYNAPGNNSSLSLILEALGIVDIPNAAKITSLRADAGTSLISGLGNVFSEPIPVVIENQIPGVVSECPVALNHSMRVLADTLGVYDLFARVDPSVEIGKVSEILRAVSNQNANTMEMAIAMVGAVYGKAYPIVQIHRDEFYPNLYELQGEVSANPGSLVSLASMGVEQIADRAKTDIAYRYALKWLNPFAVTGNPALYTEHNSDGRLDADRFSDQYLEDRADMLICKIQFDSTDKSYGSEWNTLSMADDWEFTDKTLAMTLSIDGLGGDDYRVVFGTKGNDTISGSVGYDSKWRKAA